MPLVIVWCFIALAIGTLAGICGYYLASGFTALLAVIATAIVLFAVVLPNLPGLIRKTKESPQPSSTSQRRKRMVRTNLRNSNHRLAPILLFSCFILTGCGREHEEFLWILGSHLFLIYAASLVVVLLLQRLHKWPVFISLVEKIKTPASILGMAVSAVGGWILVAGLPNLFDKTGAGEVDAVSGRDGSHRWNPPVHVGKGFFGHRQS